jgi:hypothetical protein
LTGRWGEPLEWKWRLPEHLRSHHFNSLNQKLRKRNSRTVDSTFTRIAGSGSRRAISIAPIIVEKITKNARSLSGVLRPGMNGSMRLL